MKPIATFCSDIHLTLSKPPCRDDEDWLETQAHYLAQLQDLAAGSPIVCAGDIFDRWNPPPELIRFAIKHLPDGMICVPGQHDLPNHRLDLMHRSAYGVLVACGKIVDLEYAKVWTDSEGRFVLHGYGWGQEIKPQPYKLKPVQIAIVHQYIWTADKGYKDAPQEANLSAFKKCLQGYDLAVFGDNHKGFVAKAGDCQVINNGGFIRRKSNEIFYRPTISQLYSDGNVKVIPLNTKIDRFNDIPDARPEVAFDMKDLLQKLEELGEHGINFRETVERHLRDCELNPRAKQIVMAAIEGEADEPDK